MIKRVKANSDEIAICQMLSSPELRLDPRNYSVPLLDCFVNDKDDTQAFIVMPILRRFDSPPFISVEEVVDFLRQILEVRAHNRCPCPLFLSHR